MVSALAPADAGCFCGCGVSTRPRIRETRVFQIPVVVLSTADAVAVEPRTEASAGVEPEGRITPDDDLTLLPIKASRCLTASTIFLACPVRERDSR